MSEQQFCLKWNNYASSVTAVFKVTKLANKMYCQGRVHNFSWGAVNSKPYQKIVKQNMLQC